MGHMKINAYGKINLSLDVTGRRENGYHEIRSVMQDIDLCDTLEVATDKENLGKICCIPVGIAIEFCTDEHTIPGDESNLAVKGAKALIQRLFPEDGTVAGEGRPTIPKPSSVSIFLEKKLPSAAGLAGGSGDGAAVMLALNHLLGSPLILRELMELGMAVGSDLPFSIMMNACRNRERLEGLQGLEEAGTAAIVQGIGDVVIPCDPIHTYVILMNPGTQVSTARVYQHLDEMNVRSSGEGQLYTNVMEASTFSICPEAKELRDRMREKLRADHVLMSGSGPSIAAYYAHRETASEDFSSLDGGAWLGRGWKKWFVESGRR